MRATFISHVDKSTKIQETSGTVRVDVKIQLQENLAIFIFYVRSCQEVGADHLHAVAPRFVCSQHQSRSLDRLVDDWYLAFVQVEINNLPRFRLPSR